MQPNVFKTAAQKLSKVASLATMTMQKCLFRWLSMERYLRLLQRSFFLLYGLGVLRWSKNYSYHYYAKKMLKRGDTVIDIGANLGYYSILFARWVGKFGKVYAVEPVKIYNKIFSEKSRKYDNILLYPYALGKEEKVVELVSSPNVGYLRTGLPHVYDAQKDGDIAKVEFRFEAQMKIPSRLFESLDKIDYIKCDIEGFEYAVLSDMQHIISRCKPKIQVEVWRENELVVCELFQRMGYFPHKLINNSLTQLSEIPSDVDGDYIFIHKSQL
jgi:FkbM family methyltransferase